MSKKFSGINWGTNAPISYNDTQFNVELAFSSYGVYTVEIYDQNLVDECTKNNECELFKEINSNINSLLKEYSKAYSTISKMQQNTRQFESLYTSRYSNSKYKISNLNINSIKFTDESLNIVKNIKDGTSNNNTQSNSNTTASNSNTTASNSNTTTSNSSSNTTSNVSNSTSKVQPSSSNNNTGKNNNSNNTFIIGGIVLVLIVLVVVLFSKSKKQQ